MSQLVSGFQGGGRNRQGEQKGQRGLPDAGQSLSQPAAVMGDRGPDDLAEQQQRGDDGGEAKADRVHVPHSPGAETDRGNRDERLTERAQELGGGDRERLADLVPGRGSGATDRAAHHSGRAVQRVGGAAHGVISCQPMLAACGDPGTALRSE